MSFKFEEKQNDKKNQKFIHLTGTIEDKISHLLVKLENNIYVQADKYSEVGPLVEESIRMSSEDDINDSIIEYIKTAIITEKFLVVEILLKEEI
jgi:hypothetical protein